VSLFPRFFTNRLLSLRHSDLDKYVDIVTRGKWQALGLTKERADQQTHRGVCFNRVLFSEARVKIHPYERLK
jgi:hypothetical protein